ncbi:hypothetical protein Q1695_015214 [Nippostrongylus brasiliensis]|nr:hypothetical protein Q1695_015214 [Nippostrongylus brasiliensis]
MSWLRSLQGQLSDLANEVLSEATDEVADPESELQVANKKRAEAERLLVIEQSKVTKLEERILEQDNSLSALQAELDMVSERYRTMILTRDEENKKLKAELERSHIGGWSTEDVDSGTLEQTVLDLQREVSHWKSLVEVDHEKDSKKEWEDRLEAERRRKEEEIASLVELHTRNMNEMRDMYEERIAALEGVASSSTSNTDLLDAVLLEKEELLEAKRKLEEMVRQRPTTASTSASAGCDDRMVVVDLVERSELADLEEKLRDAMNELNHLRTTSSELEAKVQESESLKIQHEELTQAYNDLNEEFEKYKETTAATAQENNNQDLTRRIDLLKANLIEYEERYEMCKRENLETVAQLERLSGEFERLKTGFADVRELKSGFEDGRDQKQLVEIETLREALEQAKQDRDRLRADVDRFRSTIEGIDAELDLLRASNRNLCQENEKMAAVIDRYTNSLNERSMRSEAETSESVPQAEMLHSMAGVHSAAIENLHRELREEIAMLQERNRLLSEESRLLAEVNAHMKKQEETDMRKTQLLEEKISLLEEHREELQVSLRALQEKNTKSSPLGAPTAPTPADEVAALTAQLREALAANAEKTEECEKLKQQTDDLEKEVTLRQSCVDEMIAQTNVLQVQLQLAAESNLQLKQQILEKDRSLNSMNEELNRKQPDPSSHNDYRLDELECSSDHSRLTHSGDLLTAPAQESVPAQPSATSDNDSEVQVLLKRVDELEVLCAQLRKTCGEAEEASGNKDSVIESLTKENEQLRLVATQKHAESVEYFNRLEAAIAQVAAMELKLVENERGAKAALAEERESREKLSRELTRLKEHLLLIEETSTAEAVEAEKRETELREQIRRLQNSVTAADTDATRTTQSLKSELSSLQERVVIAEESAEDWRARYESEKRLHSETNDALSSLQVVVRELSADHEREAASASHRNIQLQEQIRELSATVEGLQTEMERLSLDKQIVEDLLESAKSTVAARQKIVEDLELQLEEARASTRQSSESYRIDDATLRQLFLSYFTAAADKRADIALLLASILQYPPEDVHKIRQAVSGNTSRRQGTPSGSASLVEQFIRFLESESESASTAPHLPVGPRVSNPGPSIAPPTIVSTASQPNSLDAVLK